MIYTPLTVKAMNICYKAHDGQVDKCGVPYVFHPIHLAEQMDDEDSTVLALLHDVVEDSEISFEDLHNAGIPEHILEALKFLTHDTSVPYLEYVQHITANPLAAKVKRADLIHNSDTTRLSKITKRDIKRVEKYAKALQILDDAGV